MKMKKYRRLLAISSALIGSVFGLDMGVWRCNQIARSASLLPASGKNGMVATDQNKASEVGLQVLKQGGNAVDAAVAVGYALAVTDPCCGNIGGGGFMLIHLANGKDTFINFREKAPLAATANMYLDRQGNVIPGLSTKGYLAVGVPGTVAGLELALKKYGTMPRDRLINPAIKLADRGYILQQGDVNILGAATEVFKTQPNVAAIFLKNGKTPYQAGDRLVQKNLAASLRQIAKFGAKAFYQGSIADEIVKASQQNKGILTKQDFANYKVDETSPVRCNYRGYEVVSAPPPGGGTPMCETLNILEGYPLSQMGFHSAASLHRMLSSMLYAFADRNTYLGDPNFVKNPVERLLSKDYAAQIRAKISDNRATPPSAVYSGITPREGTHTTHYSIVDRYGNAVAVTYTINSYFGAGVIGGKSGFLLNNEMDDFTSKPGVPNAFGLVQGTTNIIAPGKRPLSSMTPTVVMKNGKIFMVAGSPGGSTIITTVVQVITNVIDYGMNIQEAADMPRIHYQGLPNVVNTEPYSLSADTVEKLSQMGYNVAPRTTWGAAEVILVDPKTGLLYGANDSRRPAGAAMGY
jgi:gamma-glutamyltranspeptidase/glutathione hydrolase